MPIRALKLLPLALGIAATWAAIATVANADRFSYRDDSQCADTPNAETAIAACTRLYESGTLGRQTGPSPSAIEEQRQSFSAGTTGLWLTSRSQRASIREILGTSANAVMCSEDREFFEMRSRTIMRPQRGLLVLSVLFKVALRPTSLRAIHSRRLPTLRKPYALNLAASNCSFFAVAPIIKQNCTRRLSQIFRKPWPQSYNESSTRRSRHDLSRTRACAIEIEPVDRCEG